MSVQVLLAGYAPFSPWLDYRFQLQLRENERLEVKDYYEYSLAWLRKSDGMLLLSNSEKSKGTQAEILECLKLGIPIFRSLEELKKHDWNINMHDKIKSQYE